MKDLYIDRLLPTMFGQTWWGNFPVETPFAMAKHLWLAPQKSPSFLAYRFIF